MTLCVVEDSTAREQHGGANKDLASMTIINSTLSRNRARKGGGIYSYNSSLYLAASRLSANRATQQGGGVYVGGSATCTIDDCQLDANQGSGGGAVCMSDAKQVWLHRCALHDNAADEFGGAVFTIGNSKDAIMPACRIFNNSAKQEGGALVVSGFSKLVLNGQTSGVANSAGSGGFAAVDRSALLHVVDGTFLFPNKVLGQTPPDF